MVLLLFQQQQQQARTRETVARAQNALSSMMDSIVRESRAIMFQLMNRTVLSSAHLSLSLPLLLLMVKS